MPHTGVCQLHLHGGAAAPGVQSSLKHVRNTTGTHGGTERRKRNDADANCGQGWWLRRSRVLPPVLAILILASGVCMADANASSTATPAPEGTTPAASGTPPPNMTFPMITTTPEGDMSDVNATENSTIVIENITVVNITQVNTEYVVGGSGSGGLDEELNRLVNAFKNPRQFFEATDLDAVAVSTLWATCVFFIFFSIAIALDRSRYKRKYQNNHNLLLLISLITCLNYLTMANGHGRALKHVIKEVKPYNLTRFCEKINQTNVSSTPSPDASSILPESVATAAQPKATPSGAASDSEEEDLCQDGIVTYRFMSAVASAEQVPLDPPFWYGKYIQWLINTNITLYMLCRSVAHANKRVTMFAMAFNSMMIICGLCAASLRTENIEDSSVSRYITSKWVYWVFGMVFYVMLLSVLNRAVRRAANLHRSRPELANAFNVLFFSICVSWSLYPFAWVWIDVADITRGIPVTRLEAYAYSFLDTSGKLVFAILFLVRVPQKGHLLKSNHACFYLLKSNHACFYRLCSNFVKSGTSSSSSKHHHSAAEAKEAKIAKSV